MTTSATSSPLRRPVVWVVLALVLVGIVAAYMMSAGSPWPGSRSLQQTLEGSAVVVVTAIDRTSKAERSAQDYFIRLDPDTWYQFKSDPATTTRFIFKQAAVQGEQMTLRDATRGIEITLLFDFTKKTVTYRQADQADGYELFSIVGVQALPK